MERAFRWSIVTMNNCVRNALCNLFHIAFELNVWIGSNYFCLVSTFFSPKKATVTQTVILFCEDFSGSSVPQTQTIHIEWYDAINPDPLLILHSDDLNAVLILWLCLLLVVRRIRKFGLYYTNFVNDVDVEYSCSLHFIILMLFLSTFLLVLFHS